MTARRAAAWSALAAVLFGCAYPPVGWWLLVTSAAALPGCIGPPGTGTGHFPE